MRTCFIHASLQLHITRLPQKLFLYHILKLPYTHLHMRVCVLQTPTVLRTQPIPHHSVSMGSNAHTTHIFMQWEPPHTQDSCAPILPLSPIIQIHTPKTVSPMTPIFLLPRSGRLLTKHWYVPVSDSCVLLMKMEALVVGIVTANPTRP